MRVRLPLYAQMLVWFFLNLVLLASVFTFLFTAQFSFNLDWFLTTMGARARIDAARDLIVGELDSSSPDEWEQVLGRYSQAYHTHFILLDDDAHQLVGDTAEIPREVRERITARMPPRRPPPRPPETSAIPATSETLPPAATPDPAANRPPERSFRGWRPPFRALMRTTDPTQYWLMTSARIDNFEAGDPMRVILVSRSNTLSGGGLIFDSKPWFWLLFGAIVFSLLFWLPLVRGITGFIARTTDATRRIAGGHFDVRIKTRRVDELGELGDSINRMAAQLDGLVAGQKRFLGDIAHELCSPLAHLQMTLAIIEQQARTGEEKYVQSAVAKAAQIASLVNELLSFSKASFGSSAVQLRPVTVRPVVEEAIRRELPDGADCRVEVPEHLAVASDTDLLMRAISNLLRNALRHGGSSGPILVRAEQQGDEVLLSVADSGPGVPEAELGRIFDAFYRVDSSRTRATGGTGLGLSIVKNCIETCCGSVSARNLEPHGLEVLVRLPVADPELAGVGRPAGFKEF